MVAFSRSRRPTRPISCDSEMVTSARLLSHDLGGAPLHLGVDRREHRRDRDGADALVAQVLGSCAQLRFVERRDLAAVELVAAMHHVTMVAKRATQVFGPIDHRRQRLGGGQAEPDRPDLEQAPAFDHGVGEMGGPDHHAADGRGRHAALLEHGLHGTDDATRHVRGRRRLVPAQDRKAIHEDGVRIRPPYVDTDPHVHQFVPLGWRRRDGRVNPAGCRLPPAATRRRSRRRPPAQGRGPDWAARRRRSDPQGRADSG